MCTINTLSEYCHSEAAGEVSLLLREFSCLNSFPKSRLKSRQPGFIDSIKHDLLRPAPALDFFFARNSVIDVMKDLKINQLVHAIFFCKPIHFSCLNAVKHVDKYCWSHLHKVCSYC